MWLEATVVLLGLLYIILIAMEQRWGWIAGIIGSALFVAGNLQQHLYMDAVLNFYYVLAGIYGWYLWGRAGTESSIPVIRMQRRLLIILLVASALLTICCGCLLHHYTDSSMPYLDSCVTILSFLATWMAAKRYIENWLLWLVADPLAIILYAGKGGWFYPALFAVYSGMAVYGYYQWKKDIRPYA